MKLVVGIVRLTQVDAILERLHELGIDGMTVYEVKGHGRQKRVSDLYGNVEYEAEFVPKIKIEVVVPDDKSEIVEETIIDRATTGLLGDGLVFSVSLESFKLIRKDKQSLS